MTNITVDKATIELALEAIELNWRTDEGDAVTPLLRAALAEPAPVQEQQPVAWACLFTDDGSLCQTFDTQKEADKWVESDDNLWDVYVAPLYTVQPRKADGCNWPICQTEQYQQDLADQIAKELIGEPRKAVKLSDSEG